MKMGVMNKGSPDPDNPYEDLTPNNEIVMVTDTDTDDDDAYNDYQPLPIGEFPEFEDEEEEASEAEEEDDENSQEAIEVITPVNEGFISAEDALVREVWAGPSARAEDIVMDTKKVDEVKQAMMNVTLPESSIPEWAKNFQLDEEWKQQFINKVRSTEN